MPPLPREVAVFHESDLRPLLQDTSLYEVVAAGKGTRYALLVLLPPQALLGGLSATTKEPYGTSRCFFTKPVWVRWNVCIRCVDAWYHD